MKCKLFVLPAAVAAVFGVAAQTAWAFPPSNPYRPSVAEIQSMFDRTGDFSGNSQASMTTKTDVSGGIQLDINWSTGAAFVNEAFTRSVRVQRFPDDNADGDGGDLDAYDGVIWRLLSDTAVAVKPYSQSWDNFNFQEGSQPTMGCGAGTICVPANVPTDVMIDWDMVNGAFPAGDRTNVFEIGFQVFGPGLAQDGSTAQSRITITSLVPEPASFGLALLAAAVIGVSRRRRS